MAILARHLTARVAEMIASFRVVVLGGARQTGKTTLVRSLLVPALTLDVGRRSWWPGRLAAAPTPPAAEKRTPTLVG